ncbi:MAG: hypothetical protein M1821_000076 [Bathelium mastoideum]|nr:MAG: hypothetical protein M1821_000076 [Bathelium mastoideum]
MTPSMITETSNGLDTAKKDQQISADQTKESEPKAGNGTENAKQSVGSIGGIGLANLEPKLSGAELKKRQKAEKAARREREKAERAAGGGTPSQDISPHRPQSKNDAQTKVKSGQQDQKPQHQERTQQLRRGSGTAPISPKLPIRSSQSASQVTKPRNPPPKEVGLFGHLYGQAHRQTFHPTPPKEVHPSILSLGLQMSTYTVCGSNARCVAMLLAFKAAINAYTTPPQTSLARHLTSHYLSPQITYLNSCRPISINMGNAIRWLKDLIIKIDPAVPEDDAKVHIAESIDSFIRERITAADTLIASAAADKIATGDVIVTYAKSSIVQKTLLQAYQSQGKRFRVVVVDSKPLFEGRHLARALSAAGIAVQYALVTAAGHALGQASKVLLGAHAMMSNGRLYSRVGTAVVAMQAAAVDVPVIVCCESVKFTDRVALDSIVGNEIAEPDEIVEQARQEGRGVSSHEPEGEEDGAAKTGSSLRGWRKKDNLQLLNIMYDVTPAEYIKMVVTEYGSLPPSSVPVVHRISTNA